MYKKALVTGGEALGGVIARKLAREGYDIALAHGPGDISATVQEIEAAGVHCAPLDVLLEDYDAACALPKRAFEALGGLSLAVNAGAIPMTSIPDDRAYRVNMRAPYVITAQSALLMAEADVQGAIVNVVPHDHMSLGMERVSRSAALEFSEFGIRVNNVKPLGNAEETARCVAFFASIASDYATGQLLADGVWTGAAFLGPEFVAKKSTRTGRPCALITGASHGIGRGIALKFADLGYDIAFTYSKRLEGAEDTMDYLKSKGLRGFYYQASFEQEDVAEEIGARAIADLGRIDVLVNNAGITIFEKQMRNIECERLDRLYAIDYRTPMILTRIAAENMRARGEGGCVVNISSIHGNTHYIYDAWYGGMKYALNNATKTWAAELAKDGIRVNAIAPGGTPTQPNLTFETLTGRGGSRMPLGRSGRPLDMAKCAAFFAETESVSGQLVVLDGGFTLAGVSEDSSAEAGYGWSRLRRRWNQETIDTFNNETDWH